MPISRQLLAALVAAPALVASAVLPAATAAGGPPLTDDPGLAGLAPLLWGIAGLLALRFLGDSTRRADVERTLRMASDDRVEAAPAAPR